MLSMTRIALVLGAASAALAAQSQPFLLTRMSGAQSSGVPKAVIGAGDARKLRIAIEGVQIDVPWGEILSLQGPAPRVVAPLTVQMVGGDELKGEIHGGDRGGDQLALTSLCLGVQRVPTDRLARMFFADRVGPGGADRIVLEASSGFREALFRKALRGFDTVGGEIERFTAEGVMFAAQGRSSPSLYRWSTLLGVALLEGAAPKAPGAWLLHTTAGDRLRVEFDGLSERGFALRTEFGPITLAADRVAALTRVGGDHRFLSDLDPVRVEESGSESKVDPSPLFRWRRDRTASGGVVGAVHSRADGYLVVHGATYGKGIGVHSRCVLTFRVPPGVRKFFALVAIDDEVLALDVTGDADAVVKSGDKVLVQHTGLRRGAAPRPIGPVAVEPGALLTLEVGFGKGMFLGDRVDWLSAVFLK
ncbi:MAG: NPCBM/NEW2 domain-containing protein [Planctomycetes bacterium]|nr:NPCBM/NEW2 domain-containing protein [Planctomycetota bacterium]